jgi:hypothetical protein
VLLGFALFATVACFDLEAYFTNWTGAPSFVTDEQTPRNLTLPLPAGAERKGSAGDPELKVVNEFSIPLLRQPNVSVGVFMRAKTQVPIFANDTVTDKPVSRTLASLDVTTAAMRNVSLSVGVRRKLNSTMTMPVMECVISRDGNEAFVRDCGAEFEAAGDPVPVIILFHRSGRAEIRLNGTNPNASSGTFFIAAQTVSIAGLRGGSDSPLFIDDLAVFVFGESENIEAQLVALSDGKKPPTPPTPAPPSPVTTLSTPSTNPSLSSIVTPSPTEQSSMPPSSASATTISSSTHAGAKVEPGVDDTTLIAAIAGGVGGLLVVAGLIAIVLRCKKEPQQDERAVELPQQQQQHYGKIVLTKNYDIGNFEQVEAEPEPDYGVRKKKKKKKRIVCLWS